MSLSCRKKYHYELDKQKFKKVRKTFDKIHPEISNQLRSNIAWNLSPGIKTMVIYYHWNLSVQQSE